MNNDLALFSLLEKDGTILSLGITQSQELPSAWEG